MSNLGARISAVGPGTTEIVVDFDTRLTQQHGYLHGGAVTSLADSAAGYAALTLFPSDVGVLTTEFKVNFLRPAAGSQFIARGSVLKPGRTLTVCQADVFAQTGTSEAHVLTGLFSMMTVTGITD